MYENLIDVAGSLTSFGEVLAQLAEKCEAAAIAELENVVSDLNDVVDAMNLGGSPAVVAPRVFLLREEVRTASYRC